MSSLQPLDVRCMHDLFNMGSGYVLDFSNRTFEEFFQKYAGIAIYDQKYSIYGESKAKRLKAFFELESDQKVGQIIAALLEYWRYTTPNPTEEQLRQEALVKLIIGRLVGKPTVPVKDPEQEFLDQSSGKIVFDRISSIGAMQSILDRRVAEAMRCISADAPLATIILCGSILEGLLLSLASANPQKFNQCAISPKDKSGNVKQFHLWSLAQFIDVAHELGYLGLDIKRFSHALRDFRNYVHPYEQLISGFQPDEHTALICMQVLRSAVADLSIARP